MTCLLILRKIIAGIYKADNVVQCFQRNKPMKVNLSRDNALMDRRKFRAFSMAQRNSFALLHIFGTSEPILMLVPAPESWGSALPSAAISTENGVKTKDLRSLEKSRNCGIFESIFPELRVKCFQGLKKGLKFICTGSDWASTLDAIVHCPPQASRLET